MTRIDRLYMDNLSEFIFDDKKVVTFKFLSCTLGVHVNIAKQMLFHFHSINKDASKKVYATYYISGTAPQGIVMEPTATLEEIIQMPDNPCSIGYVVALCKDQDVEWVKKRFTKIHSIHIYALSAFPLDNIDILKKAMKDPIYQERNPVDFGSISCKTALEIRETRRKETPLQSSDVVKSQTVKLPTATKEEEKKESSSASFFKLSNTEKQTGATGSGSKKSTTAADGKKSTNQNQGDNRLKNMFAASAAKPSTKEKPNDSSEEKIEAEVSNKSKVDSCPKQSSNSKTNKKKGKPVASRKNSNDSQSRKRKRIKDVLSSSSEEDEKPSDIEEYGLPESPVPRKRTVIESDSDEDFTEVTKKSRAEEEIAPTSVPGKRKVSKTVSKTFMDEDGFLVTTKEQVMVSEPEMSDSESTQLPKCESLTSTKEGENGNKNGKEPSSEEKALDKKDVKVVKPTITANKSKQSTLTSFFQKK